MKTSLKYVLVILVAGLLALPVANAKQGPDDAAMGMANDVPVGIAVGPTESIFVFENGYFNLTARNGSGNLGVIPLPNPNCPAQAAGGKACNAIGAQVYAPTMIWVQQTKLKVFGGQYQAVFIQPLVYQNLDLGVNLFQATGVAALAPLTAPGQTYQTKFGLANTGLDNMLGWHKGNWFWKAGLETWFPDATAYTPPVGALGDTRTIGNRYWEFDPTFAVTYIKPKSFEFGLLQQISFDTTDNLTHYHSGDEYMNSWTLLKTVKRAGIGVNGFVYQQFTNDTCPNPANCLGVNPAINADGSYASVVPGSHEVASYLGVFGNGREESQIAIGPHFQFATKNSGIFNIKYFHNVYTRNALGGDQFELEWVMPVSKWWSVKKS